MLRRIIAISVVCASLLYAESVDDALEGFGDEAAATQNETPQDPTEGFDEEENSSIDEERLSNGFIEGLSGEIKQQFAYALKSKNPQRDTAFNALRTTLFLDYEHKFENGWKLKTNGRAFYDWAYRQSNGYTAQERDALEDEVELFDAYIEGSITDKLDFRIGRQVVVWGRSDTIRITDILNPLDNRQPGMVDIEDLRLPVAMAKFDYYIGKWRITPIAILEQRFTKDPPFGSPFYPSTIPLPDEKHYDDVTYALSVGAEFSGWDINFYGAHIYDDTKFIQDPFGLNALLKHEKIDMFGTALNILSGSWLFKSEWAYFDKLRYTMAADKKLSRLDGLVGIEYNGIADTMISYDFSLRHFTRYDERLSIDHVDLPSGTRIELLPVEKDTWQHALRITSDFLNATLHANYLISLYGKSGDEGGYQRLWAVYDIDDRFKADAGILDFIGGSKLFDLFKKERTVFVDLSYSF